MIGQAFHWANLALAFLLELCALAALGYQGGAGDRCADLRGGPLGVVRGAQIIQWDRHGGNNQLWQIVMPPAGPHTNPEGSVLFD